MAANHNTSTVLGQEGREALEKSNWTMETGQSVGKGQHLRFSYRGSAWEKGMGPLCCLVNHR